MGCVGSEVGNAVGCREGCLVGCLEGCPEGDELEGRLVGLFVAPCFEGCVVTGECEGRPEGAEEVGIDVGALIKTLTPVEMEDARSLEMAVATLSERRIVAPIDAAVSKSCDANAPLLIEE